MADAEEIPDSEVISRHVEAPRTFDPEKRSLILELLFEFPDGRGECVVWRRYAATDGEVHSLGKAWEEKKRARQVEAKGVATMKYVGFLSAGVVATRALRSAAGHGFEVSHTPDEGMHHAEIIYKPAEDSALTKPHKTELKLMLQRLFSANALVPRA